MEAKKRTPYLPLVVASLTLIVASVLHDLDHVRQGRSLPGILVAIGLLGPVAAFGILALSLRRDRIGWPAAVIVGAGTVVGLIIVHLLPRWSILSDPYPEVGVDALSWLSLGVLMAAGAAVAVVGVRNMMRR